MTRTKRGKTGRESGDRDSATGSEHRSKRTETPERTTHIAATNPAAVSSLMEAAFRVQEFIDVLNAGRPRLQGIFKEEYHERFETLFERIRYDLDLLNEGANLLSKAEARAERAEARVKELEGIPERDCGCDGDGCGCCEEK